MRNSLLGLLLIVGASFGAYAQHVPGTTFGNPYPTPPQVIRFQGNAIHLPPASNEQPRYTETPVYYDDYYYPRAALNIDSIQSSRNVLSGARGPSHHIPITGSPGSRNITGHTPIHIARHGSGGARVIVGR